MVKRLIKSSPFWSIVLFVGMCLTAYVATMTISTQRAVGQVIYPPPGPVIPPIVAYTAANVPISTCLNTGWSTELSYGNQCLPPESTRGPQSGGSESGCSSCSTGGGAGNSCGGGIGGAATAFPCTDTPGRPEEMISTSGSLIDNGTLNYVHYAWDYHSKESRDPFVDLQIVRYYRSRDVAWWGSFGPGAFCNYDIKLTGIIRIPETETTINNGMNFFIFDPSSMRPVPRYSWNGTIKYLDSSRNELDPGGDPTEFFVKFVQLYTPGKELFEFEVFAPEFPTLDEMEARLIRLENSKGYGTSISYKTWTPTEITESPERQWQIDTVTSDNGQSLVFEYASTMVGGRWVVSSIEFPNGEQADYSYADARLSEVDHADGSTSTFGISNFAVSGTDISYDELAIFDPAADPVHRHKKVYLSKLSFNDALMIWNQSSELAQIVINDNDEVSYMCTGNGYYFRGTTVYLGAKRLVNLEANSTYHHKDGWTFGITDDQVDLTSTGLDSGEVFQFPDFTYHFSGTPNSVTDIQGVQKSYEYTNEKISKITYSDTTYETFCYNGLKQVTRHRDRLGRVTLSTYDAQGNLLTHAVGLQEANGNTNKCATNDVQTADYAISTYEYYGAMDTNKYLLKKMTDGNGNATNYEYDSNHRLTKVIQPPDIAMGTRAETVYDYDTAGRLETVTAPDGSDTSYEYDAQNRVKKITYEDATTERSFYGTGTNAGLLVKTVDRRGAVTDYTYDNSGRVIKVTTGEKTMNAGGTESTLSPSIKVEEIRTYLNGTDLVQTVVKAGEKTEYVYDYRQRVVETKVTANTGKTLVSKKTYVDNKLFSTEDPYGRKTFNKYDTSDARLVRSIQGTVPSVTYADYTAVAAASRPAQNAANATSLITDYQYNAESEVTKVTDPRGYEHTTEYDYRGRATAEVKADGTAVEARTEMIYDDASNVTEIRTPRYFDSGDTNGHTKVKTTMTYTGRNRLKTRTEAPGTAVEGTETLSYDLMGRVVSRVDMRGKTWSTAYPTCCGRTTTSTDPLGHGTITHTNANGQLTHVIAVSDVSTHMSLHNPTDNKTHREVTTKYDVRGRKVAETVWLTPLGLVDPDDPPIYTGTPVNDSANPPMMVSTYGLTTTWAYDDDLDDSSGLDGTFSSQVTGLSLGSNCDGSAVLTTLPSGERSLSIVDGAGRSVRTVQLDGSGTALVSETIAHDAVATVGSYGDVIETTATNQASHTNKIRTDAAGRTIETVDGAGKVTKFTYNPGGNRLSVRDPNNIGRDCVYDALGRDIQCTDTASNVTSRTFDLEGNVLTRTDAKSNSSVLVYDARGRRAKLTDRLGGETEWTYDLAGNELTMEDAESQVTTYEYDDLGRRIKATWPDHVAMSSVGTTGYGITEVAYTPISQVLRATDQLGDTITNIYDLAGRLTQRDARTRANSPSGTIAFTDGYTFDAGSRLLTAVSGQYSNTVTLTYSEGRLASEGLTIGGQTYTTGVGYDFTVPKVTLTYPDSSVVERTLNSRGLLSTLKLGSTTVLSRTYDDGGRLTQQTFGNGIVEDLGYVANDSFPSTRETGVGDFSFTWDENRNKTSESITGAMSGYGWSTGMNGFDEVDRLVARNQGSSGTQLDESWDLSLVGDIGSSTTNGTTTNRTHGNAHKLTAIAATSILSDLKGNTLNDIEGRTFQWDWNNQMKSADLNADMTPDVVCTYDALRRRASKAIGGTTIVFFCMGHESIADYPIGAAANSPIRSHISTGRIDEPVVMVDKTAAGAIGAGTAELFYYHHDANGNVRGLTDAVGGVQELYAYSSYGTPTFLDSSGNIVANMSVPATESQIGNRFLFTSRDWDAETRLYSFRARMMSPSTGRFLNRDPLSYHDGPSLYRAYFLPGSRDPMGTACETYHVWEMAYDDRGYKFDDPRWGDLIIATITVCVRVDTSQCREDCGKCSGKAPVLVSFEWTALTDNNEHAKAEGWLSLPVFDKNGRVRFGPLGPTPTLGSEPDTCGKSVGTELKVGELDCTGGSLTYTAYVVKPETMAGIVDREDDPGFNVEEAFDRSSFFVITGSARVKDCGKKTHETISMHLTPDSYNMWLPPIEKSPRISPIGCPGRRPYPDPRPPERGGEPTPAGPTPAN